MECILDSDLRIRNKEYWTGDTGPSSSQAEPSGQKREDKDEGKGSGQSAAPAEGRPLKPETGGTSPFEGRGKPPARSALRQNQELERDYRRHKRVSRSSFARNRSRPPKSVREAKGRGKGPAAGQAAQGSAPAAPPSAALGDKPAASPGPTQGARPAAGLRGGGPSGTGRSLTITSTSPAEPRF